MTPKIACLGIIGADTVAAPVDALPKRGTLDLIERIELHVGGCASNTAIGLAKLGAVVVCLGAVGQDGYGDFVLATMGTAGVDTGGVRRLAGVQTGTTIVCIHGDTERSFLHVPGACGVFRAEDVDWEAAAGAALFHIAGPQLMPEMERGNGIAQVVAEAKRRGMRTTLDTVMNPRSLGWAALAEALPYFDWALPSEAEAELLTGETDPLRQARAFRAGGARNVAIKCGAQGCLMLPEDGEAFTVPAFPVAAVDALGAGDAWVAGFLRALSLDWPPDRAARFANAVGACAVQAYGSTTGVRSHAETEAFLAGYI